MNSWWQSQGMWIEGAAGSRVTYQDEVAHLQWESSEANILGEPKGEKSKTSPWNF